MVTATRAADLQGSYIVEIWSAIRTKKPSPNQRLIEVSRLTTFPYRFALAMKSLTTSAI